jgi:hypothetical protein
MSVESQNDDYMHAFCETTTQTMRVLVHAFILAWAYAYMLPWTLAVGHLITSCFVPDCMLQSKTEMYADIRNN